MAEDLWTKVDHYLEERLVGADQPLRAAIAATAAAGMPAIQVSPTQGKFLQLLATAMGARAILEIGTLAGYSAIWLARALPADGRLVSLEVNPRHAAVARSNLERAGLTDRAQVRLGPATESLAQLAREHAAPFDLVFIDADKARYPDYLAASLQLARPGTLIVADNVVREGRVLEADSDQDVEGIRRFLEQLGSDPRLSATALQTVGEKGYDGFAVARVLRLS